MLCVTLSRCPCQDVPSFGRKHVVCCVSCVVLMCCQDAPSFGRKHVVCCPQDAPPIFRQEACCVLSSRCPIFRQYPVKMSFVRKAHKLSIYKLSIYKSSLVALKGNIVSSILQIYCQSCQSGDISSRDCPAVNKDSLLQSKVSKCKEGITLVNPVVCSPQVLSRCPIFPAGN